jgi:hypothetical protein
LCPEIFDKHKILQQITSRNKKKLNIDSAIDQREETINNAIFTAKMSIESDAFSQNSDEKSRQHE